MNQEVSLPDKFISFDTDVADILLPERFTFPFYYQPHEIAVCAAEELKEYLRSTDLEHDFGIDKITPDSIGKMFGVLVVSHSSGKLGYLAAFSGKVADSNDHERFVPPVYDMLQDDGYFRKEEQTINALNQQVHELEQDPTFLRLKKEREQLINHQKWEEQELREAISSAKAERKKTRKIKREELSNKAFQELCDQLAQESIDSKLSLKHTLKAQRKEKEVLDDKLAPYFEKIEELKSKRAQLSGKLQRKLFNSYQFLNQSGEKKSLLPIFEKTALKKPPAGAGECAAPKLLQYAFEHDLKPIALAEFWWGAPPNTAVRKHGNYYPACQGKCEPILGHMLKGIELDDNPLIKNLAEDKSIETIFEDDYILVINKPHDLLSVPGKEITDSVLTRIKIKQPDLSGPVIVHRLDMATSGVMVLAKDEIAYKLLQRQFLDRSVVKTYTAVLDRALDERKGRIELPLRLDVMDRPRQCVCYEHGKRAKTDWRVDKIEDGRTRVIFKPITGRTHQLRVHAAHKDGLNAPILGDDLYGKLDERLHLHATTLSFEHPKTKEKVSFTAPAPF